MTQQNAALVEQSAAAAESLREQAHKLASAVAGFKLDGTHSQTIASPSPTLTDRTTVARARPSVAVAQRAATAAAKRSDPVPAAQALVKRDWKGVERRSPQRATNVSRLPATPQPTAAMPGAAAANGSDDEWESF